MSVEAYNVTDINGYCHGALLICNTTGLALPLSHNRFADAEEGEAFMRWMPGDPRRYSTPELEKLYDQWIAADKPCVICPDCGAPNSQCEGDHS